MKTNTPLQKVEDALNEAFDKDLTNKRGYILAAIKEAKYDFREAVEFAYHKGRLDEENRVDLSPEEYVNQKYGSDV